MRNDLAAIDLDESLNLNSKLNLNLKFKQNLDVNSKLIHANNDVEAIKTWLMQFKENKNTLSNYRKEAERFWLWCNYKNLKLNELMFDDILLYREFCQNPQPYEIWVASKRYPRSHPEWKPFSQRGIGLSSLRLAECILGSMFSWLCNSGYLSKNPFKLHRNISLAQKNRIDRYFSRDLWSGLLDSINHQLYCTKEQQDQEAFALAVRNKWIISLFYLSGIRISESLENNMQDIVSIKSSNNNAQDLSQWWINILGKGNKHRRIPVHSELIEVFKLYRRLYLGLPELPVMGEPTLPLICKKNKIDTSIGHITRACLHNWIKQIFSNAKEFILSSDKYEHLWSEAQTLNLASAHWIRHTTWTHMADNDIDLRFIRDNAGHASISTTGIYLHSEDDDRYIASIKHSLVF
jgi:integrase/recombinase XerD